MRRVWGWAGALVAAGALLSGCMTLPVKGEVKGSDEIFVGEATGFLGGAGTFSFVSSRGVRCTGTFQYSAPIGGRSGTGRFDCPDGRAGTFVFNSTGTSGVGFGTANTGEQMRFSFGAGAAESAMW